MFSQSYDRLDHRPPSVGNSRTRHSAWYGLLPPGGGLVLPLSLREHFLGTSDVRLFANFLQIECAKVFLFKDEKTKGKYIRQYTKFRERNRRWDELVEHNEVSMPTVTVNKT